MPCYRLAKAAEHAVNIEWMRRKLVEFRAAGGPHLPLLNHLDEEFTELRVGLELVKAAARIPGLEADADDASRNIAIYLPALAVHYIAGLERQTPLELEMHGVILRICGRLQLNWIEGVLVRLSHHLAILPAYRHRQGIPVFYGPPNLLECYLSLPGIYHELGHNVFVKEPEIGNILEATVFEFFEAEKAKIGPLPPAHRDRQIAAYDDAIDFWTSQRVAELFCDLFAGYVCGPANVISIMDLAMAHGSPPTGMQIEYPPNAVRVAACHHLLSAAQAGQPLMQEAFVEWQAYEAKFNVAPGFNTFCPPRLVELLAKKAEELIAQKLAQVPRYIGLLPSLVQAQAIQDGVSLEDLINAGFTVMLEAPDEFAQWHTQTRSFIR